MNKIWFVTDAIERQWVCKLKGILSSKTHKRIDCRTERVRRIKNCVSKYHIMLHVDTNLSDNTPQSEGVRQEVLNSHHGTEPV